MADMLHGVATYPGLTGFLSADYTVSHGVSPGLVTIKFAPPDDAFINDLAPIGDVLITDGFREIPVKDCIASGLVKQKEEGYIWTLTLYDRRWKWQFGSIDGRYNERDNSNRVKAETKLKTHDMATRLLDAMGEKNYDLGDLPDPDDEEQLPTVNWEAENPAKALADLCDVFNCRVIFQPIANRVKIMFAGSGAALPTNSFTEYVPGLTKPIKPRSMEFVGGPLTFVTAVRLDAVGEDIDGSIVPIDDLSYTPVGGWGKACVPNFAAVVLPAKWAAIGKKQSDVVALAQKCVFRYYRASVGTLNGVKFETPGLAAALPGFELKEGWQIVLLESIFGTRRDENRTLYNDPPRVYGVHVAGYGTSTNSLSSEEVKGGFTVDQSRGLVIFNRYIMKYNLGTTPLTTGSHGYTIQPGERGPGDIAIVTSVNFRDFNTKQVIRFRRPRLIEQTRDTQAKIIRRDDIIFSSAAYIYPETWTWSNNENNGDEVIAAADAIMDQADDFDRMLPESYAYPRIVDIDPDGAISQITWAVGGACSTRASRNGEHTKWMPPYKFRRGQERVAQILQQPPATTGGQTNRIVGYPITAV
jgi:hypothetical protein